MSPVLLNPTGVSAESQSSLAPRRIRDLRSPDVPEGSRVRRDAESRHAILRSFFLLIVASASLKSESATEIARHKERLTRYSSILFSSPGSVTLCLCG